MAAHQPAPWSTTDLARRLAAALGTAAQVTEAVGSLGANPCAEAGANPLAEPTDGSADPGYCLPADPGYRLSNPKVIAEAAMLLFCAASVQDTDERIRDGVGTVARLLVPHARSHSVLAAICLDPGQARDHAVAHVILSHLGYRDHDVDRLLSQSLAAGQDLGPERLPHRELEQRWLARLFRGGGGPGRPDHEVLAGSSLGRPMDALGSALLDKYAFTHAVLYASDLGQRTVMLPRPAADIAADADAMLAACLDANDFDLSAEVLWTWPMLGLRWSATATFAFQVLTTVEDEIGFLPGQHPGLAALRSLPAAERLGAGRIASYHTALVMGFLCAATLRPGCAPPAAVPCGSSATATGAGADVMRLITAEMPKPRWREAFGTLAPCQQDSLAGMVLSVALQQARRAGDMELVHDCLEVALHHGLIDGPVLKQAVALLRRGAALSTAGRGLLAAAR